MRYKTCAIAILIAACASVNATAHSVEKLPSSETVVLAGGCFWGVEGVFEHVKGVTRAESGYAGGSAQSADYESVSAGTTGHAEVVKVTYDPAQVTLNQLLDVYFLVAHDPTQYNYQGPDRGTQYRSAIFYRTAEQKKIAEEKMATLAAQKNYKMPIVTALEPLTQFHKAEEYHQNYLARHPHQPYIMIHDAPKIVALKQSFPAIYIEK